MVQSWTLRLIQIVGCRLEEELQQVQ